MKPPVPWTHLFSSLLFSSLLFSSLLFSDHCSLLTAHCSLLTAHCSLLTAHCSLLTAHCSLLTAHCSLLTAHCSLLTAPFRYTPADGRVRGMTLKLSIIGNGQQSMGDATLDDIRACLEQKSGVVWIDASGPSIEEIDAIGKLFHFHALSLEDAHR